MVARLGQVLRERWTLDAVLGVGGFAAVYAATHRAGKRVAIKVLHPELCARLEIRRRFIREAYAANRVDHPGTVSILDDDVDEKGQAFLVMELLEGENLEARRARCGGKLSVNEVLRYGVELLDVLQSAHEHGVIHRDLKPENLFLTRAPQLKVLDFGVARVREVASAPGTQAGCIMGTPAFMAPEQARGRSELMDARTDLFGAGATLFTLLTGEPIHGEHLTLSETLVRATTTPARRLQSVAPTVPPFVADVVDRALAFGAADRWPDAGAMRDALQGALAQLIELEGHPTELGARATRDLLPKAPEPTEAPSAAPEPKAPSDLDVPDSPLPCLGQPVSPSGAPPLVRDLPPQPAPAVLTVPLPVVCDPEASEQGETTAVLQGAPPAARLPNHPPRVLQHGRGPWLGGPALEPIADEPSESEHRITAEWPGRASPPANSGTFQTPAPFSDGQSGVALHPIPKRGTGRLNLVAALLGVALGLGVIVVVWLGWVSGVTPDRISAEQPAGSAPPESSAAPTPTGSASAPPAAPPAPTPNASASSAPSSAPVAPAKKSTPPKKRDPFDRRR